LRTASKTNLRTEPEQDERGRPVLDPALQRLVKALVRVNPVELGHIRPEEILFVFGAARGTARASIRGFGDTPQDQDKWVRPNIVLGGRRILYEICLRPRFFLDADPKDRIAIVAHELWHIAPAFDGTLAEERRHRALSKTTWESQVLRFTQALADEFPNDRSFGALFLDDEARLRAWRVRPPNKLPPSTFLPLDYSENDFYLAITPANR
jgi:predicted metallopeptidase